MGEGGTTHFCDPRCKGLIKTALYGDEGGGGGGGLIWVIDVIYEWSLKAKILSVCGNNRRSLYFCM